MRSCKNHGVVGGVRGNVAGVRAAGRRRSRRLFSRAIERGGRVSASPGDVGVRAARDVRGECDRLRDDNGQRRRRCALWRYGNNNNVANALTAAAAGQSESGQDCRR